MIPRSWLVGVTWISASPICIPITGVDRLRRRHRFRHRLRLCVRPQPLPILILTPTPKRTHDSDSDAYFNTKSNFNCDANFGCIFASDSDFDSSPLCNQPNRSSAYEKPRKISSQHTVCYSLFFPTKFQQVRFLDDSLQNRSGNYFATDT